MNSSILACYVNGVFNIDTAVANPDNHVAALTTNLHAAATTSAAAKKALFAIKSHRTAYEQAIKLKDGERRRSIIAKHIALCSNFKVLKETFVYYGNLAQESGKALIACIPGMIEAKSMPAQSSDTNRARRNNTVLCARILKSLPEILRTLHEQHQPDNEWHISDGLCNLRMGLFRHEDRHLFAAPLEVAYIENVVVDETWMRLQKCLQDLAAAKAACHEIYQAYMQIRSRALNVDQYRSNLSDLSDLTQARTLVQEMETDLLSYEMAFHAAEAARYRLIEADRICEEAMVAASAKIGALGSSLSPYKRTILKNNLIAARCQVNDVDKVLQKTKINTDAMRNQTHGLSTAAYKSTEQAFADVPARYEGPYLGFLNVD